MEHNIETKIKKRQKKIIWASAVIGLFFTFISQSPGIEPNGNYALFTGCLLLVIAIINWVFSYEITTRHIKYFNARPDTWEKQEQITKPLYWLMDARVILWFFMITLVMIYAIIKTGSWGGFGYYILALLLTVVLLWSSRYGR